MESIVGSIISGLIVAVVVSFVFAKISKRQEKHERERTELLCSILEMSDAHIGLSRSIAIAVRDHKCNGEMTEAMCRVEEVKRKQAAIVREQVAANF